MTAILLAVLFETEFLLMRLKTRTCWNTQLHSQYSHSACNLDERFDLRL